MKRATRQKDLQRQTDPGVLAVLHHVGRNWHGVVARTEGGRCGLLETRKFPDADADQIDRWLEQHAASEVLVVLPAASVVCRTCPLPDVDHEQLQQTLALQAEAHQLDIAPDHRRAMAVLDAAPQDTSRTGLILAWPESAKIDVPATDLPVRFVPDTAALAALMNGHRPSDPIVWVDRATGSIALALSHENGAVLRGTQEDLHRVEGWERTVGQVVAETGLNAGHTPQFVQSIVSQTTDALDMVPTDGSMLLLPPELLDTLTDRIRGLSADEDFWSTYGIALGAVLARSGSLRGLTNLQHDAPIERQSIIRSVSNLISSPDSAIKIAIVCILILALSPAAFSFVRWRVLDWRYDDLAAQKLAVTKTKKTVAIYEELQKERWTMTKLLGDLACNTPIGIELESILITTGKGMTIQGKAFPDSKSDRTPQEAVAFMQEQMQSSRVFGDISVDWGEASNMGSVEFSMTAKIDLPHYAPRYEVGEDGQDFGDVSLRERLYPQLLAKRLAEESGDPGAIDPVATEVDADTATAVVASRGNDRTSPVSTPDGETESRSDTETTTTAPVAVAKANDADETDGPTTARGHERSNRSRFGGSSSGGRSRAAGDGLGGGAHSASEIPPAVTQAQVDAMSKEEARDMLAQISRARNHLRKAPPTDESNTEEIKDRLKSEWDMLIERIKN